MAPALESRIEELQARLRHQHPGVSACRVSVADRPPHVHERLRFNVRIDVACERGVFVVNREHDADPRTALEAAFVAAERQLETLRV